MCFSWEGKKYKRARRQPLLVAFLFYKFIKQLQMFRKQTACIFQSQKGKQEIVCFFVCKEYKNIIQIASFNNILFANEGTAKKEKKALFGFIGCFILN